MSGKAPAQPSPSFCDQGNLGPQLKSICTVLFQFKEKKMWQIVAESAFFMRYDCPLEWWSPRPGFDPTLLLLIAWLLSCLANNPFQPQISNL